MRGHNAGLTQQPCNLADELGPDRLSNLLALSNRDYEGSRTTDHTITVVGVQVLAVGAVRPLQHQRQAIDDALSHCLIACLEHGAALIVGTITRDVDHLADSFDSALVEKFDTDFDRTRDRGSRRSPDP